MLNLAACTYQDIWYSNLSAEFVEEFEALDKRAEELGKTCQISHAECFAGLLVEELRTVEATLRERMGGDDSTHRVLETLSNVIQHTGQGCDESQRLALLQKLAFFFRKSLPTVPRPKGVEEKIEESDEESEDGEENYYKVLTAMLFAGQSRVVAAGNEAGRGENDEDADQSWKDTAFTVISQLNEGVRGRCPDGQNSFFEDFLLRYQLAQVRHANSERFGSRLHAAFVDFCAQISNDMTPTSYLQSCLAMILLDWKKTFIARHTSPFLADSEERTVQHTLLVNLLRMPLSIPGKHAQVLYPSFAFRQNPEHVKVEAVVARFLEGGTLQWKKGSTQVTRRIPKLSLAFVGHMFRESIRDKRPARPQSEVAEARAGNFIPMPRMGIVIDDAKLREFVESDAGFLSLFYEGLHVCDMLVTNILIHPLQSWPPRTLKYIYPTTLCRMLFLTTVQSSYDVLICKMAE